MTQPTSPNEPVNKQLAVGSMAAQSDISLSASVVTITGEVDLSCSDELRSYLLDVVHGSEAAVRVDLTTLAFIDSVGLGSLVAAKHRADDKGITFSVELPKGPARQPFELTGLDKLLSDSL